MAAGHLLPRFVYAPDVTRRALWALVAIVCGALGFSSPGYHAGTTLYYIFEIPFIENEDVGVEIVLVQMITVAAHWMPNGVPFFLYAGALLGLALSTITVPQ